MALISAAEAKGIEFFLQISAAGASSASSEFMTSKAAADSALSTSSLQHCILRPGLVISRNAFGGTEMMRMIAAIPLVAPSVQDARPIQCVALSDVIEAVSNAVTNPEKHQGRFDLVEAESRLLSQIIDLHRLWLGFPPPLFSVAAPLWAIKPVSLFADMLGWFGWRSPLRRNSIAALINGVSGHADESEPMLGRPALPLPMILQSVGSAGKADRWHARAALLFPFVLASLIVLWLGSAILGLTRADAAADYLVIAGMKNSLAHALVLGGSLVDLAIAAALLFRPGLRIGLIAAILATLAYMIGSLFFRPDLWLDPLGPMLKTVPVLALCLICLATSDER